MLRLLFQLILRLNYTLFTGRIPEETFGETRLVVPPRNPGAPLQRQTGRWKTRR
jgi:hypothetical protein